MINIFVCKNTNFEHGSGSWCSSGLLGRHEDFADGTLDECYIVHRGKAVMVEGNLYQTDKETIRTTISEVIEKLRA